MMPKPSIWMLRLALVYLLISVSVGGLLLIQKTVNLHPMLWSLLPIHFELAIWGWLVQFVMGTAYWMFPRFLKGPKRGNEKFAIISVVSFNAGLLFLMAGYFTEVHSSLRLSSRFLMLFGVTLFVAVMWNRVLSYRQVPHEHS